MLAWGNINGTLSAQGDLQAALDEKLNHYCSFDVSIIYICNEYIPNKTYKSNYGKQVLSINWQYLISKWINFSCYGISKEHSWKHLLQSPSGYEWASAVGAGITWGAIIGNLSDQTDLQAALDAKLSTTSAAYNYVSTTTLTTNYIHILCIFNFCTTSWIPQHPNICICIKHLCFTSGNFNIPTALSFHLSSHTFHFASQLYIILNSNPAGYISSPQNELTNYPSYSYASSTLHQHLGLTQHSQHLHMHQHLCFNLMVTFNILPLSAFTSLAYIPFASSTLYYLNSNPAGYISSTTNELTNYPSYSYAFSLLHTSWITTTSQHWHMHQAPCFNSWVLHIPTALSFHLSSIHSHLHLQLYII